MSAPPAPPAPPAEPPPSAATAYFPALDAVRVIATVAIYTFHFLGQAPFVFWTWTQEDIGLFMARYPWYQSAVFFTADVGVQAFIYLSMFSLTYAALGKPSFRLGP